MKKRSYQLQAVRIPQRHPSFVPSMRDPTVAFVPRVLLHWPDFAEVERRQAAILFIDIAGFTKISETLESLGTEGAELLDGIISRYFDAFHCMIQHHGGIPIKISGDALTVLFLASEGLPFAVQRALGCAAGIRELHSADLRHPAIPDSIHLAHKIGVGCGVLQTGYVGNPYYEEELAFVGNALDRASAAEQHATAHEVIVGPEVVAQLASPDQWLTLRSDGFAQLRSRREIATLSLATPGTSLPPPSADNLAQILEAHPTLVPLAVREPAEDGSLEYLRRHQSLTVLFAGSPPVHQDSPEAFIALAAHYRQMQAIVSWFGGYLSEFEAGDKGPKLIVLFGAPKRLKDPCTQAAHCALAMLQAARKSKLVDHMRISITTGRLYVGRIGCHSLAKYSALGHKMNLAAKLLPLAEPWEILADRSTVSRTDTAMHWSAEEPIRLGGPQMLIDIARLKSSRESSGVERRGQGFIGHHELLALTARLLTGLEEGRGALLKVSGVIGIGKTRFLGNIRHTAQERGIHTIAEWNATLAPQASPLSGWRPLLLELLKLPPGFSPMEAAERLERWSGHQPSRFQAGARYLAPLIGLDPPKNSPLGHLALEELNRVQSNGLMNGLPYSLESGPAILLIDDGDRVDDPSLRLLKELAPFLVDMPLLVVLVHREGQVKLKPRLRDLEKLPDVHCRQLQPLETSELLALAQQHLCVQRLSRELADFLISRTGGNPLLIEAWLDALKDRGQLSPLENVAYLERARRTEPFPERLEDLLLIPAEQLPSAAKLTLGVASVIGQTFRIDEIAALHPMTPSRLEIRLHLRMAGEAKLVHTQRSERGLYFFVRPELQTAIHDSLPFSLRRKLHKKRAGQLLRNGKNEPLSDDLVILLARHYLYIEEPEAQLDAFCAGVRACYRQMAPGEAIGWSQHYLASAKGLGRADALLKVAKILQDCHGMLGEQRERRAVIDHWLQCAEERGEEEAQVQAFLARSGLHESDPDCGLALADIENALKLVNHLDDPLLRCDVLTSKACALAHAAQSLEALRLLQEVLQRLPHDDIARLSRAFHSLGLVHAQLGQMEGALDANEHALELYLTGGNLHGLLNTTGNKGIALTTTGRPEEGRRCLEEALALSFQTSNRRQQGKNLLNLGQFHLIFGNLEEARANSEEASRIFCRLDHIHGEGAALLNLLTIDWLTDDQESIDQSLQRLEPMAALLWPPIQAQFRLLQGQLALEVQEWVEAEGNALVALKIVERNGLKRFQCEGHRCLAEIYLGKAELAASRKHIDLAIATVRADPHNSEQAERIFWTGAAVAEAQGKKTQAQQHRLEAWGSLRKILTSLKKAESKRNMIQAFPWNRAILAWAIANLEADAEIEAFQQVHGRARPNANTLQSEAYQPWEL